MAANLSARPRASEACTLRPRGGPAGATRFRKGLCAFPSVANRSSNFGLRSRARSIACEGQATACHFAVCICLHGNVTRVLLHEAHVHGSPYLFQTETLANVHSLREKPASRGHLFVLSDRAFRPALSHRFTWLVITRRALCT